MSTDTYLDRIDAERAVEEARDEMINAWFEALRAEDPYIASVLMQGPTDEPHDEDATTAFPFFTRPAGWFLAHLKDGA